MTRGSVTANEALADGLAYVRDAWRDVWAVQLLVAVGVALVFVSQMGRGVANAGELFCVGAAVILVSLAPLFGALYRIELGGKAEKTLGPLGLQLGLAEGRLWVIWLVRGIGAVAAALAVTAVSALAFILLRPLGAIRVGSGVSWQISFLIAAALWLTAGAFCVYAAARLSLVSPTSVDRERLVLSEVWPTHRRQSISLTAAWIAVRIPSFVLLLVFLLVDGLENGRLAFRPWPLPDAAVAGLLIGGVLAFVQAPLAVGALASFYRHIPRADAAGVFAPAFAQLAAAVPPPPPSSARPLHDRPNDPTERFRQILGDRPEPAGY
jgi:hypothetical protein